MQTLTSLSRAGVLLAFLAACGGTTPPSRDPGDVEAVAVDADTLGDALRRFYAQPLDAPARAALRGGLVAHFAGEADRLATHGDYEGAVELLRQVATLLTPTDFEQARVPEQLVPLARFLVSEGSRRSDEARVLAALRILRAILDDPELERESEEILNWSRVSRSQLRDPIRRLSELVQVWEEQAELAPAPEVLDGLAGLHIERRDTAIRGFSEAPQEMFQSRGHAIAMQVARDVAAVYLRVGDVNGAIAHIQAMGAGGEAELQLLRVLDDARRGGPDAADALLQLAGIFAEARPPVALGIARLGLREHRTDPRFPMMLARIAAVGGEFVDATAWYMVAVERAPDHREVYDEALERLDTFIARGSISADAAQVRQLARYADELLQERNQRFPGSAPPVAPGRIDLLMGVAEMHAGNPEAARTRLEASLAEQESGEALMRLALLSERLGDFETAVRSYRAALDRTAGATQQDRFARAELLGHLGDAFRGLGNAAQSARMYRQAAELLEPMVGEFARFAGEDPRTAAGAQQLLAMLHVRLGILRSRLGETDASRRSFRAAMMASPRNQEIYATILAHLVTSAPDPSFAAEVFNAARRQLRLDSQWKVYFALWTQTVAQRAGAAVDAEVTTTFEEESDAGDWAGALARFGAGELPYDELSGEAENTGHEAEAAFYEGTRLLARGDAAAASELFERVISLHMVLFFEHQMAQELLTGLR